MKRIVSIISFLMIHACLLGYPPSNLLIEGEYNCFDAHIPETFGNTHFIIGFPHEQLATTSKKSPKVEKKAEKSADLNETKQVLFSPDDNLQQALINLIKNETKKISIAIYSFTNKEIAQALVDAKGRGVDVQVICDPSNMKDRYSKIGLLQAAGVKVHEYNPDYVSDKRSNLLHHKFVVFSDCLWTGSFNFTNAANERNQENAVILTNMQAVKQFSDQFDRIMKQRCVGCQEGKKKLSTAQHNGKNSSQLAMHSKKKKVA